MIQTEAIHEIGLDSTTNPIAGFQHNHIPTRSMQSASGRQPGHSRPNHNCSLR
jgi:hypothetical protein